MRLIDADVVVANLDKVCTTDDLYGMGIAAGISRAMMAMDNAPTIEAEPVRRGRWIKRPDERICPFCNDRHSYFGGKEKNYCPNCGAKMDKEGE